MGERADRRRGSIRVRGGSLQVRVFVGRDAVTGRERYLSRTVGGTDRAARRRAEKIMTALIAGADTQRTPGTSTSLGEAIDAWLATAHLEETTRRTYVGYIERTIKPALGNKGIDKLTARDLEAFYADLRRCRLRCRGVKFIEKHRSNGDHDCAVEGCRAHVCRPLAASTVRQMHSVISGNLVRRDPVGLDLVEPRARCATS